MQLDGKFHTCTCTMCMLDRQKPGKNTHVRQCCHVHFSRFFVYPITTANNMLTVLIHSLKIFGLLKFQCQFEFLEKCTIRCLCYFSIRCWLFWDRAQNRLICSTSFKGAQSSLNNFFQTFEDFGITRKLIFFSHNLCQISQLKSLAFGRHDNKCLQSQIHIGSAYLALQYT